MEPLLCEGMEVLARSARQGGVQEGQVWVLRHPERSGLKIVKLVRRVSSIQAVWVEGLNADESEDSRHFGEVRSEDLLYQVTSIFSSLAD